ncbi:MAG: EF-P lysine aminoacylase EpmA [Nitrospinota bacterium]
MEKPPSPSEDWRIRRVRSLGLDPYPGRCHPRTPVSEIIRRAKSGGGGDVWAAGRLLGFDGKRHGRCLVLSDLTGSLPIAVDPNGLSAEGRKALDLLEAGDILEVRLRPAKDGFTAEEVRLLAPCLQSGKAGAKALPEPEVLRLRARVLKAVRGYFDARGYLEVETPALLPTADPAPHLAPFVTEYADSRTRRRLFLQTSPELCMKRLLGAGHERIYQITKFFRNGERTSLHNPEFTGLEWYEAYADYRSAMETAEGLVYDVARTALGRDEIRSGGMTIGLRPPWERLSVREAFRSHAGVDLWACLSRRSLAESARCIGIHVAKDDTWEDLFFKISLGRVEPHLGRSRPTLLLDYPAPLALLAKRKADDPAVAERFEIFAGGMELANGFTELNDPQEQRARWEREIQVRRREDPGASPPLDEPFLGALRLGVPPAAGVALGLDRLILLLSDRRDIGEVRCFAYDPGE